MAVKCAYCGSADVLHGGHEYQCMACGRFTNYAGEATVPDSALAPDFPGNEYAEVGGRIPTSPPAPADVGPAPESVEQTAMRTGEDPAVSESVDEVGEPQEEIVP